MTCSQEIQQRTPLPVCHPPVCHPPVCHPPVCPSSGSRCARMSALMGGPLGEVVVLWGRWWSSGGGGAARLLCHHY